MRMLMPPNSQYSVSGSQRCNRNARLKAGLHGPPLQLLRHSVLQIGGNDTAGVSDETRHGQREIAHPTANIDRSLAWRKPLPQDLFGVMDQTAQRIVEGEAQPPGTHMVVHQQDFAHTIGHGRLYCWE
jgi:hypothetical protein